MILAVISARQQRSRTPTQTTYRAEALVEGRHRRPSLVGLKQLPRRPHLPALAVPTCSKRHRAAQGRVRQHQPALQKKAPKIATAITTAIGIRMASTRIRSIARYPSEMPRIIGRPPPSESKPDSLERLPRRGVPAYQP